MDSHTEMHVLPILLRVGITEEELAYPISDWTTLLELARLHHVEALLWYSILKTRMDIPENIRKKLRAAYSKAMFQDAQQEYLTNRLSEAFCRDRIPHVLLRGAVLKKDYPEPCLRTMSDLDYLVRVEDYSKIKQVAEAIAGKHVHTDGGHFTFLFPPQVMVEFHPNLIYTASPVGTAINPGWQYARPGSGPYTLELTEEGFYLNMVCHLAYHFAKGGTGVRSVLDLWVYRHRHTPQPDWSAVNQELERAGLLHFTRKVTALSEAWFGGGAMTPELEEMETYILTSGTHGVERRAVLNAACFSMRGTGFSALTGRAFYPREELENRFPWTRGKPWLLPAAWCVRAAKAVTQHHDHILRWGKAAGKLSKQEIQAQRELLRRFGFQIERGKRDA